MKMAKASERDIDAAGDAMSVLNDITSGYYPKRDGDECDDHHFDPEDPAHLRKFYDLMTATLDASPGWPGRVIGGMCYVILFDKNEIVDPSADTLELHPRFAAEKTARIAERDALLAKVERMERGYKTMGEVIHNMSVANQSAWIEWQHGKGAEAAMVWVHNGLVGPGLIPDEDDPYGKEPQAWYDANKANPLPTCHCGRPSNIGWMGHGACSEAHYAEAKAKHAAEKNGGAA